MRAPRWLGLLLLLAPAACSRSNPLALPPNSVTPDDAACVGPLGTPLDPSKLPACCTDQSTHMHCLPDDRVPAALKQPPNPTFAPCDNGWCLPDEAIATGGVFTPRACTSTFGPGACVSVCVPAVQANMALLQPDVCRSDELCVPCISPIDQKSTGVCEGFTCNSANAGSDGGASMDAAPAPMCPYTGPPLIDVTTLAVCPLCAGAHCLPNLAVGASLQSQLQACDAQSKCVPDEFIVSAGLSVPATCRSLGGVEGRCLSRCLPAVIGQEALLPRSTCDDDHRCVPCFDPTSGAATGACAIACDHPVEPAKVPMCPYSGPPLIDPAMLPACPANPHTPDCSAAHCLPTARLPSALGAQLADCDAGDKCVPDELIESGGLTPPATCRSIAGVEGRCLSRCLPSVADQDPFLPKDSCDDAHRCVPCFDPTSGAATGACTIACDKPVEAPFIAMCGYTGPQLVDPTTLPACAPTCDGAHCLPASKVPASLGSSLTACENGGRCVPDGLIEFGGIKPPTPCRSLLNVEGRCLSTCLPDVAAQADVLPSTGCADSERCVPCFDPTTGVDTHACRSSACDNPMELPVVLTCPYKGTANLIKPSGLPACSPACAGAHCLPNGNVPASLASQLAACDGAHKCVPDELIRSGGLALPATCRSAGNVEGRCLSLCLPAVAAQGPFVPQSTCDSNHRCVPCYDPVTGADTHACEIACDLPQEPDNPITCPYYGPPLISDLSQLAQCNPQCAGAHCMPNSMVPTALAPELASCNASNKCVPDELIVSGGETPPPTCRSLNNAEGRCLSKCLPSVAAEAGRLPDCSQPANHTCVPCFDPISGADTHACEIACDLPAEGPSLLPKCCNSIGTCLPSSIVPQSEQSNLQQDVCPSNSGFLCVPQVFIDNPSYKGTACSASVIGFPLGAGVCLPACIKGLGAVDRAGCPANFKCAPCNDLFGNPTGAC